MPLARIEIEQITGSGWVARVEAQDFNMNARGLNLLADSFDEIMILVEDGYREIVPLEAPPKKPTVTEPQVEPDVVGHVMPEPLPLDVKHPLPKIAAGLAVGPAPARDVKQSLPPRESTESARTQPPVRIDAPAAKPRDDRNPYVPPHGPSRR